MSDELLQALDVPRRDIALIQEVLDLVQPLNAVALLAGHSLTVLADVLAVAAPAEFLVSTIAATDATEMAHAGRAPFKTLGLQ
ncbi:MAG: hypothetical protein ACLQU3_03505 [Limisphaerales bacterium]